MASVRTINVKGTPYLQVVEYGGGKTKVLKSFGTDNHESRLKAIQFADNYNTLDRVAAEESEKGEDLEDLVKVAGGVFGLILGVKVTEEIIKRYKDRK